jgi:hypothetical protein
MADSEIGRLIDKAHDLLRSTNKPHIVYRRNGKYAVIPLQVYLNADLDAKGAKRICTVTRNMRGEIV